MFAAAAATAAASGRAATRRWSALQGPEARCVLGGTRTIVRHPIKMPHMSLGHKLEVVHGPNIKRKNMPPKIPKHPLQDIQQNMNEVMTYNDLKLRWKWTTRFGERRMKIARKWKPARSNSPIPQATCSFVWHRHMPHRRNMPELPEDEMDLKLVNGTNSFAIFKSSPLKQHKVTVGDLVQCEKLHRREAGEKIVFGTVLLVGSKEFTIIGKPTVPYAKVKATIEQQTLSGEKLIYSYKPRRKQQRFLRRRQYLTMIRIDEIVVEPGMDTTDPPPPKPLRLLDLWANRWLDPIEKEGIEMVEGPDGASIPKVAELYDGSEHQPGTYHRRGLTSCYRFWPDPQHTHWRF
eukprot:TRINITY_DN13168_c0_g1_i1.p1 TRINITY_DN13168_c0_g1~~TRINITY_DN13168_c0_g1_i1.p1  ORF type:complete len:348 (-),score=67.30 TRINITY_DN13168_c0_g1_i1:53-1096(-)